MQQARPNLESVLRQSGRAATGGRRQARFRQVLVVCQIALAAVLLAGAGLLLRSFQHLSHVDLGIRADNVLTFSVNLPVGRYADAQRRADFHVALQDRLNAIAGIEAAGAVSRLPVTGSYHTWSNGRIDQPNVNVPADQRVVEGRVFEALGIRLLRGRTFDRGDGATPRRIVINDRLARTLFPSEDPIGRRLRVSGGEAEIIGVVADVANAPRTPPPRSSITCTDSSLRIATGPSPQWSRSTDPRPPCSTTFGASCARSIPRSSSISRACSRRSSGAASPRNASRCWWSGPTRCWR